MPKIEFKKELQPIVCESGAELMRTLLDSGHPVASSCHGKGVCSKCRIQIVSGSEHLSPETHEEKFLRERNKIPDDFRISCQTRVLGDVKIDAPYW